MTRVNAPPDLPHALHAFLTAFYRASDTSPHGGNASANALYADFFCADAPLLMGDKTFTGREEYVKFREAGWEKVASREHVVLDVFPKEKEGKGDAELMLRGTVAYGMKDGSNGSADWAGHMKLRWLEKEGGYKLAFYQVWITMR